MNTRSHNLKEHVLKNEVPVTVYLENEPDLYFFGVMNPDRSGDLNVYTNGRLRENDQVVIKSNGSGISEGRTEFAARIISVNPTSSPEYTYTYEYGIRYPG